MGAGLVDSRRVWQLILSICGLLLLGAAIGGTAGYLLGRGDAPRPESIAPAPAQQQADGSLVLERRPAASPAKAPHQIPRGAVEERRVAVTVQPEREDCPPVRLDLSLIRDGDGRRVITSSPDGRVTGGLDIPIERSLIPPPARRWAAGVARHLTEDRIAVWVERDFSRVRIGAEIKQSERSDAFDPWVRVGFTFD